MDGMWETNVGREISTTEKGDPQKRSHLFLEQRRGEKRRSYKSQKCIYCIVGAYLFDNSMFVTLMQNRSCRE